jgi:hypothetical protein
MKSKEEETVDRLLEPSWLSGFIAVTAGLVVTVGVMLIFSFNNSQMHQQLVNWENTAQPALSLPGQDVPGSDNNSLQNTWPLLAFWMIIGLIVYILVEGIVRGLRNAAELRRELTYVHAQRDVLLKNAGESVLVRLLSAIVWLIFTEIFFKRVIPYSITAAQASVSDILNLNSALDALLSFSMIVLSVHVQAIFLRLAAGRPRLFSSS